MFRLLLFKRKICIKITTASFGTIKDYDSMYGFTSDNPKALQITSSFTGFVHGLWMHPDILQ